MKLGVSACLLGEKCRYDGKDKKDRFVIDKLSLYFQLIPLCPEIKAFSVPREPINLILKDKCLYVEGFISKKDLTQKLNFTSKEIINDIKKENICGFILKSKSPSCGVESTNLHDTNGVVLKNNQIGIFAKYLKKNFPLLPLIEEGVFEDKSQKESFLIQIFAYKDLTKFLAKKVNFANLVEFHSSYKYLIYAKSQKEYKNLGNIVANHKNLPLENILIDYKIAFIKTFFYTQNISNIYNVLLHVYGYFKKNITKKEKKDFLRVLEDFKSKKIGLNKALEPIRFYANKFDQTYILKQKLLNPYPEELLS